MLQFVKPNTVLLLSERIIEDNQPSQKYAHFDRAFIVTNEEGYDVLLKTASEIFKDESIEFFGDFVATKNIDYIVSVQWGILEAFLRACYDQIINGVVNIPHIAYDIYMNDTYRKYFPFLNFDEKILNDMESQMHQSTYDLLSYDDLCNIDQDIALRHITVTLRYTCDRDTHQHLVKNMDYRSCVGFSCNPTKYIVPVEVIQNGTFNTFKSACNNMYKVYQSLERDNYGVAKTILPGSSEHELTIEMTLENIIKFLNRYVNKSLFVETMEQKVLIYLTCVLIKDAFGVFVGDQLDDITNFLAKDSNAIADALSVWNSL